MSDERTRIDKETVLPVLIEEWVNLDRLLAGLPERQWALPTRLPGWRVTDVVAHLIGTDAMIAGDPAPAVEMDVRSLPHVRNGIAAINERWVQALRDEPPASMLRRFRDVIRRGTEMLERMSQADFDAPSWTPAGQDTYGRLIRIRVLDCWLHEQDIRDAVGLPGGEDGPAAELSHDEAALGLVKVIGKRAAAPDGATVLLDLTGPVRRRLAVAVDGKARPAPELATPPTVSIRMSSSLFMLLYGGRTCEQADVELDGDLALGQRVIDNLGVTP